MTPKLYMRYGSPPVRSVLLCTKALGLELELKEMNLHGGDHLKPEFLKLNPQHTIPTLEDDDGFAVWDSHAIMPYLVGKYGKDKSLYPEDLKKRAIIDQRLHFDSNVLATRGSTITRSILFQGYTEVTEDQKTLLYQAFDFIEKFLEGHNYIAGDSLTIADFSFTSSITSFSTLAPFSESQFPRISAWLKRMEKLPYYNEANAHGLNQYKEMVKQKLAANKKL